LPPNTLLIGRYLILSQIGRGGMGAVYQARDVRLPGKLWAVKELTDAAITDPTEKQRAVSGFQREAHLLASLDHPNIPKVVDSFSQTGNYYLVMEYVEGDTLENLLAARGRPFSEAEVRPWLTQLCSALAYLHSQRPPIIFRDLKPDNIMLSRTGQIKLIDFGIARFFRPGKAHDTAFLGTTGYAPPEQYGQGQTDARSDVYGLGVTVHRLLTGYDPTATPLHLPPVRQLNPGVSQAMERVIARALEHDPAARWQSVGEIQAALQLAPPLPGAGAGGQTQVASAPPLQPLLPSRPTTRLLLAAAQLSGRQLAFAIGSLMVLVALWVWLLAPIIQRDLPIVWNNVPAFIIAGPAAYAVARRRGAAILAHVPITLAGWLTLWARMEYAVDLEHLVLGAVISGLVIEFLLSFLPRVKGTAGDEAWKREMAYFALLGIAVAISFYLPIGSVAHLSLRPGVWVSAAVVSVLGWFLGDLVQQWLYLRQAGMRRPWPTP